MVKPFLKKSDDRNFKLHPLSFVRTWHPGQEEDFCRQSSAAIRFPYAPIYLEVLWYQFASPTMFRLISLADIPL